MPRGLRGLRGLLGSWGPPSGSCTHHPELQKWLQRGQGECIVPQSTNFQSTTFRTNSKHLQCFKEECSCLVWFSYTHPRHTSLPLASHAVLQCWSCQANCYTLIFLNGLIHGIQHIMENIRNSKNPVFW